MQWFGWLDYTGLAVSLGGCWSGPRVFPGAREAPGSLSVIFISEELVVEEVHGLLSKLGEVDHACDRQGDEQQRQQQAPHHRQDVVASGFGAEVASGLDVTSHLLIPRLQQPSQEGYSELVTWQRRQRTRRCPQSNTIELQA